MALTNTDWDGSASWAKLHRFCLAWDGDADSFDRFLAHFNDHDVPCGSCSASWRVWLAGHPPDKTTKEAAFAWSVDAHNAVRRGLGQAEMGVDAARDHWSRLPPLPIPASPPLRVPASPGSGQLVPSLIPTDREPVDEATWRTLSQRAQNRTPYWTDPGPGGSSPSPRASPPSPPRNAPPVPALPRIPADKLASFFDRVVVINLKRRTDRLQLFRAEIEKAQWPFCAPMIFEAVDGKALKIGDVQACMESHRRVLKGAIDAGASSVLIMEDDVIFCPHFADEAERFLRAVPADWDSIFLGWQPAWYLKGVRNEVPVNMLVDRIQPHRCHAYAVRGKAMRALYDRMIDSDRIIAEASGKLSRNPSAGEQDRLHSLIEMNIHADKAPLEMLGREFAVYGPHERLAGQRASHSDLMNGPTKEDWYGPVAGSGRPRTVGGPIKPPGIRRPARVSLFVNVYNADPQRQAELNQCLSRNLNNPHVDVLYALTEPGATPPNHPKLKRIDSSKRPTFDEFFEAVGSRTLSNDINVVLNSDIYFDDSLARVRDADLLGRCLMLLRWHPSKEGGFELNNWSGIPMNNSQDVWIFRGRMKLRERALFPMGAPGCDNRLARLLADSGYETLNPAFDLKSFHLHANHGRNYPAGVPGPHAYASPCLWRDVTDPRPIISFSLFGRDPQYIVGATENAKLAKILYPGWEVRFYHDSTVPADCIQELNRLGAVLIPMPQQRQNLQGTFWRFLIADHLRAPRWIVRDVDSRLNEREVAAVEEWILSRKSFHVMHDHPSHLNPIIASAFGGVRGSVPEMSGRAGNWHRWGYYGADEHFLAEQVWPVVRDNVMKHSAAPAGDALPFPTVYADEFVGEKFNERNEPNPGDRSRRSI